MTKSEKFFYYAGETMIWGFVAFIILGLLVLFASVGCAAYLFLWDVLHIPLPHSEPWHTIAGGLILEAIAIFILCIFIKHEQIREKYNV